MQKAVRLFPYGIPSKHHKWIVPEGVEVSEYAPFLKKISTRTVPTPISDIGRGGEAYPLASPLCDNPCLGKYNRGGYNPRQVF